jgi:uncharacterized protein YbjT (DUF2867 family)
MTVLVVGATGLLGTEICQGLTAAGKRVRALVRPSSDRAKVRALTERNVEIVRGDLKDPPSLKVACTNVDTVISTASSTFSRQEGDNIASVDRHGQLALVEAARSAGVSHFIFVSFSGNVDIDTPLEQAKREVEQRVIASGMTYTILRPSYFMEVWLSPLGGFDYAAARARIFGSGQSPASVIALGDVARYAVACVDNPAVANAVIELGGPEALSQREIVRTFEAESGRHFDLETVPEDALETQWSNATEPMERTFAGLMLALAHGDKIDTTDALRRIPLRLTSVREYARRVNARPSAPVVPASESVESTSQPRL